MAATVVLVIDENPAVQAIASLALTPLGVKVVTSASAEEGLKAAEAHRPAIVICPYEMQHSDSLGLCNKIKTAAPVTRFLLLTSHANLDSLRSDPALSAVDDFLAKPFKSERLKNAVEGLLNAADTAQARPDDILVHTAEQIVAAGLVQTIRALGFGAEAAPDAAAAQRALRKSRFKGVVVESRLLSPLLPSLKAHVSGVIVLRSSAEANLQLPDVPYRAIERPVSVVKLRTALAEVFGESTAQGLKDDVELDREEQSALAAQISAAVFEKLLTAEALKKGNWKLAGSLAAEELLRVCAAFRVQ